MSIEAMVARLGVPLYLYRPTTSVGADGEVSRSYARAVELRGFVDPGTKSSDVAYGRATGRVPVTIYLSGYVDVRIDDEIRNGYSGTVRNWRVTGATNPGETYSSNGAPNMLMTVVACEEVEPGVTL